MKLPRFGTTSASMGIWGRLVRFKSYQRAMSWARLQSLGKVGRPIWQGKRGDGSENPPTWEGVRSSAGETGVSWRHNHFQPSHCHPGEPASCAIILEISVCSLPRPFQSGRWPAAKVRLSVAGVVGIRDESEDRFSSESEPGLKFSVRPRWRFVLSLGFRFISTHWFLIRSHLFLCHFHAENRSKFSQLASSRPLSVFLGLFQLGAPLSYPSTHTHT